MRYVRLVGVGVLVILLSLVPSRVGAQSTSSSYKVEESQFGTGGELDAGSSSYQAHQSAGGTAYGNATSASYETYSGFITPNEEYLEFTINTSSVNLGTLSASTTATGTATFRVRTYLNSGYVVRTLSNPPTAGSGAQLSPLASPTASSAGTEQFGINLKANTAPATFGADPVQSPNSSYATGEAATGYSTANQYKYGVGDTIANSNGKGWGQTDFTISYIANINPVSKAGQYTMVHNMIIVATY